LKYLVVGNKHRLHHVASWLSGEVGQAEVGLASIKAPYQERAWEGILPRVKLPPRRTETWEEWVAKWPEHEVLITDSHTLTRAGPLALGARPPTDGPTSPLALGGWWDGETLQAPHWVIRDVGLWPGGLGPAELGGVTLVAGVRFPLAALESHLPGLGGFRGLIALDLMWDAEEKGWRAGRLQAGWPFLHAQAFLWAQPSVAAVLEGKPSTLPPYVVGVPACVPPYPYQADVKPRQLFIPGGAGPHLVLFDAQRRGQELWTAGLDGLVALSCGKGHTLASARRSALEALPAAHELGARQDVGQLAEGVMVELERAGWL
jgi:hypothetical protein